MVHKRLLPVQPFLGEHVAMLQSAHRSIHTLAVGVEDLGELSNVIERLIAFKQSFQPAERKGGKEGEGGDRITRSSLFSSGDRHKHTHTNE